MAGSSILSRVSRLHHLEVLCLTLVSQKLSLQSPLQLLNHLVYLLSRIHQLSTSAKLQLSHLPNQLVVSSELSHLLQLLVVSSVTSNQHLKLEAVSSEISLPLLQQLVVSLVRLLLLEACLEDKER